MVFIAVGVPPLLLGLLLVLDRYEEKMFGPVRVARHARRRGHLSLVADAGRDGSAVGPEQHAADAA